MLLNALGIQLFKGISLFYFPPLLILSRKCQLDDAWFGFCLVRDSKRSNEYVVHSNATVI